MKIIIYLYFSLSVFACLKEKSTEELIDLVRSIDKPAIGYSLSSSGDVFLPVRNSANMSMGIVGQMDSSPSPVLSEIVSRGAAAIPFLIKHMNDKRTLKLKPMKGMMWTEFSDEYDYNSSFQKPLEDSRSPAQKRFYEAQAPQEHKLTVGDICFVALGQIVNRHFQASRYQPTAGLVINSPSYSENLYKKIVNDYANMTKQEHRQLLLNDVLKSDSVYRINSALMRIHYYYPEDYLKTVLEILERPYFNGDRVDDFISDALMNLDFSDEKKINILKFQLNQSKPFKDGILRELFNKLYWQLLNERNKKDVDFDARTCLVKLFDYKEGVKLSDYIYSHTLSDSNLSLVIDKLLVDKDQKIIQQVFDIFSKVGEQDGLAISCVKFLMDKGYNVKLKEHCNKRLEENVDYYDEYKKLLKKLSAF